MRIARFLSDGEACLGIVSGDELTPLSQETELVALLAAAPAERERIVDAAAGPALALADQNLLAPIEPGTFRDFVAFEEHVEGTRKAVDGVGGVPPEWYEAPQFYFSNPYAIVGPADDVPIPPGCERLDYELEVAAILGRGGSDMTVDDAARAIAGYTVLNDWSARDLQSREMRVGLGTVKGKDFASTLGPWIVTADELEPWRRDDRLDLDMSVAVNGTTIGDDTLANMGWSFEEMIVYSSRGAAVRAGDVIGSGTCGSGCLAELWGRRGELDPPPLTPGDVVTMTVEGIGTISNRVVAGRDAIPIPVARPPRRRARAW